MTKPTKTDLIMHYLTDVKRNARKLQKDIALIPGRNLTKEKLLQMSEKFLPELREVLLEKFEGESRIDVLEKMIAEEITKCGREYASTKTYYTGVKGEWIPPRKAQEVYRYSERLMTLFSELKDEYKKYVYTEKYAHVMERADKPTGDV